MENKFIPTIGIEIHLELLTNTKMFSASLVNFSSDVNTIVSPIDLALPGVLPIPNAKGLECGIKIAHLLNCSIPPYLVFDRKNYFYPDLTKGYQITQDHAPIGTNGHLDINVDGNIKTVRIAKVQLEEDTAKQIHESDSTLLDYNRCGNPLSEIVTQPDFVSAKEVVSYVLQLKRLFEFTKISDAKMEEGSLRVDVNVSVRKDKSQKLGTKVEIKNINSLASIAKAIEFEIKRQSEIILTKKKVHQETRRFDEASQETVFMRNKTDAIDYKYFTEPNIPPVLVSKDYIESVIKTIPTLPDVYVNSYTQLGLKLVDAQTIVYEENLHNIFKALLSKQLDATVIKNVLLGDIIALSNKLNLPLSSILEFCDSIGELLKLIANKTVPASQQKSILEKILQGQVLADILKDESLTNQLDGSQIREIVDKVIADNPDIVTQIKQGKDRAIGFLIAQVIKLTNKKADPKLVSEYLNRALNGTE
jgi:aspartyl-tRNA(Asn)/glutamyl-tRNA(Gln) amidotransferase subunit B